MSCNHLNDCSRCGGLVDSLETEVMCLEKKVERLTSEREVILNALRKEGRVFTMTLEEEGVFNLQLHTLFDMSSMELLFDAVRQGTEILEIEK